MAAHCSNPVNPAEFLYRLRASNGDLLYVGITTNWPQRMTQHQADKPWWSEVQGVELVRMDCTRQQIEAIEKAVIKTEAPRYNVVHSERQRATDLRTQDEVERDDLNSRLVAVGIPPIAVLHNGTRAFMSWTLGATQRQRALYILAQFKMDMGLPDGLVCCAWTDDEHHCMTTAAETIARGSAQCFEGPMLR